MSGMRSSRRRTAPRNVSRVETATIRRSPAAASTRSRSSRPARMRSRTPRLHPSPARLGLRAARERRAGEERVGRRRCGLRVAVSVGPAIPAATHRPGEQVAWMRILSAADRDRRARGDALRGPTKSATTSRGHRGRRRPGARPCASRHGRAHRRRGASRAIRPRAGCRGPKSSKASYRPAAPRGYPAATGSMHRGSSFAGRLTKVLTGQAVMVSGGHGPGATSAPASQGPNASGARIAGIR